MTAPLGGKRRERVYDRWWPHRLGTVTRRTKTTATVRWDDGESWTYDRAHQQFLVYGIARKAADA